MKEIQTQHSLKPRTICSAFSKPSILFGAKTPISIFSPLCLTSTSIVGFKKLASSLIEIKCRTHQISIHTTRDIFVCNHIHNFRFLLKLLRWL